MKLDFGRTADRIYINAKTSVTFMGNAGGGGGKTGIVFACTYTIIRKHDWQGNKVATARKRD